MLAGEWKWEASGKTFIYWKEGNTIYVAEGHHRTNAALEIGRETGDWSILNRLLESGIRLDGDPARSDIHRFPTRSFWSRFLSWLDW